MKSMAPRYRYQQSGFVACSKSLPTSTGKHGRSGPVPHITPNTARTYIYMHIDIHVCMYHAKHCARVACLFIKSAGVGCGAPWRAVAAAQATCTASLVCIGDQTANRSQAQAPLAACGARRLLTGPADARETRARASARNRSQGRRTGQPLRGLSRGWRSCAA